MISSHPVTANVSLANTSVLSSGGNVLGRQVYPTPHYNHLYDYNMAADFSQGSIQPGAFYVSQEQQNSRNDRVHYNTNQVADNK